jgi:hypothetical protein
VFAVYGGRFASLVGWAVLITLPFEVIVGVLQLASPGTSSARTTIGYAATAADVLLVAPLVTVVMIRFAEAFDAKTPARPGRWLLEGVELLPVMFVTLLAAGVVAASPLVVVLAASAAGPVGVIVTLPFALVASAQLVGRLSMAVPVVVSEQGRFLAALRRSNELARGAVWRVLFVAVAVAVVAFLVMLPASLLSVDGVVSARAGDLIGVALASPIAATGPYYLLVERRQTRGEPAGRPG